MRIIASQTTPGVTALAYEAVLDNANSSHFIDVSEDAYYGRVAALQQLLRHVGR